MSKLLNILLDRAGVRLKEHAVGWQPPDEPVMTIPNTLISLDRSYWVSADGRRKEFMEMSTTHLTNTILMLIRMCPEASLLSMFNSTTFQGLAKEYKSRHNK